MKKILIFLVSAAALAAAADNTIHLDMESVASITGKNGKFHGGEFADGAPLGDSVTNGNRGFVGGGAKDGIELPSSVLALKQGSVSLYFKIGKNAPVDNGCFLLSAIGASPYYQNFGISITPRANNVCDISFTLVGAKGVKKTARSVVAKKIALERDRFYHLAVNWENINSGCADGSAELYLNGKLVGQRRNELITVGDIGRKLFVGSVDLEHAANKCGEKAFVLDEVEISDAPLSRKEIGLRAKKLPADDPADGRLLPKMPVKGGGKKQFTSYEIADFPISQGAIFCRFRLEEIMPGKSVIIFDNTASPAWNNRIALSIKMFENNVVEFYLSVNGARTKTYTSKALKKSMPLDPTMSHTILAKWKNINSKVGNGIMELYVDGINVANLNGFMTRFDKVSDVLRLGGGVPPAGGNARKDLLTIEECRIWRGEIPAGVQGDLFQKKNNQTVDSFIRLPIWRGEFKNDGRIDRKFWLRAADFGNFHSLRQKGITENTTQVKAACDDRNLYLMWRARHPEAVPNGSKHGMRDAALWRQDSMEFHFDTPKGKVSILISAYGEIYDCLNKVASWNSTIRTAVDRVPNERVWTGTATIPLSEITEDKDIIKGQVCRNISILQDSSSGWKYPYGKCGEWKIGTSLVVNRVEMPDMVSVGENTLSVFLASCDRKPHTVRTELTVNVNGKTETVSSMREIKPTGLEIPVSFTLPVEGRAGYSLLLTDENGDVVWSNSGFLDVKPQLALTLSREFYHNKLNVSINAQNIRPLPVKGSAQILRNDLAVGDMVEFSLDKGRHRIVLDTSKMDQHGIYTLAVTVVDSNGKSSRRTENFEFSPKPAGYPLNAGKKPWFGDFWFTPKFENGVVKCWNRVYSWHDSVFPSSITSAGVEMLAGTPYLEYRVDGKVLRLGKADVKPLGGDVEKTVFEVNASDENLIVHAKVRVEYDGFIGYDLNITPRKDVKIDKLAMVIPMKKDSARVKLQGLETTYSPERNLVRNYPASGRHFKFAAKAGLGCFERGLFLCNESDEGWLPYDRDNVEEIIPDGDRVLWRWNIVDGTAFKSLPRQRMGFQVTPYKPLKKDQLQSIRYFQVYPGGILRPTDVPYKLETLQKFKKLGANVLILHLYWSKYTGGYEPDDAARFRAYIQEAHKLGMRVLVYRASITNEYEPSFLYYGDLWKVKPSGSFYGNPVSNKYKLSSTSRCVNSPGYIDWYVGMAAKLIRDYDVDGFYYDFGVGGCSNALHNCGYAGKNTSSVVGEATDTIGINISEVTAEDKARRPTTPVLKQRELWKRMYNMVKELKGDAGIIDAHTSAPDRVFSYPFVDSMYHSESAATHRGMRIDPEMYRLYFTKQGLGTRGELILYTRGKNQVQQTRRMLAISLLHREMYRPMAAPYDAPAKGFKTDMAVKLWGIFSRNRVDEGQWLPYWKNQDLVAVNNGGKDALVSLWRHDDRLLLVVSNLGNDVRELNVSLKGKLEGFTKAVDAENPKIGVSFAENTLQLQVSAQDFRLIEITR